MQKSHSFYQLMKLIKEETNEEIKTKLMLIYYQLKFYKKLNHTQQKFLNAQAISTKSTR